MSRLDDVEPILRKADTIWVGLSGGLDSTVLLHLVKDAGYTVKAIHVNHQLSINSNIWEDHCRRFAKSLDVEFFSERVEVIAKGAGLESAARDKRMAVFARHVGKNDVILLAHHACDQLETLLYRLMRGTGLKGLTGIRSVRRLLDSEPNSGRMLRPLLQISQEALQSYALRKELTWVDDESNVNVHFDRNFIRARVVPALVERWPEAPLQVAKTATFVENSMRLLGEYAHEDLLACGLREERYGESLSIASLQAYSLERRYHVVRYWVELRGYSLPGLARLQQLDHLIDAKDDAFPELKWGTCEFHRFQNRLFLHPLIPVLDKAPRPWNCRQSLDLPLGEYQAVEESDGLKPGNYTVSFRNVGERCKPNGRRNSQTLKKLLQEYQLEPWLREYVPIVYAGKDIAAVGDLFICEGGSKAQTLGLRSDAVWIGRSPLLKGLGRLTAR